MNFIFDPSLVLYLPLHELDGSSFMSRDAYGHICTVTGALWRANGRYFDGADDRISILDSPAFTCANGMTACAWVNGAAQVNKAIIGQFDINDDRQFLLYTDSAGYFRAQLSDNGTFAAGHLKFYISSVTAFDSSWHLCGFTWDNSTLRLFLDGVEDTNPNKEDDDAITSLHDSSAALTLGCYLSSGAPKASSHYAGLIGESWIYNRALNPQEIQRDYLATKWRYQ